MPLPKKLVESIAAASRLNLVIHLDPDGDAIGSARALQLALEGKKKITLTSVSPIPAVFQVLLGPIEAEDKLDRRADLILVLDCNELHRTGLGERLTGGSVPIGVIDHHPPANLIKIAPHYYRDQQACSTAELVISVLQELRLPINRQIAQCLLLGIYTDTGGFRHPNTTSQALRLASRLIRYGADLSLISQALTSRPNIRQAKLWGKVLSGVTINRFGLAVAVVTKRDLLKAEANQSHAFGLVNILSNLAEARAALVLVESDRGWQASLRTRFPKIDLNRLASYFDGRGRGKMAGFLATKELISGKI